MLALPPPKHACTYNCALGTWSRSAFWLGSKQCYFEGVKSTSRDQFALLLGQIGGLHCFSDKNTAFRHKTVDLGGAFALPNQNSTDRRVRGVMAGSCSPSRGVIHGQRATVHVFASRDLAGSCSWARCPGQVGYLPVAFRARCPGHVADLPLTWWALCLGQVCVACMSDTLILHYSLGVLPGRAVTNRSGKSFHGFAELPSEGLGHGVLIPRLS